MTTSCSSMSRIGQVLTGAAMLVFAIGASAVSLTINFNYGLQTSSTAAAIFVLSDGAKIVLLVAIGGRVWPASTRTVLWSVWVACFSTSLWAAGNAYIEENAADLFSRGHRAEAYAEGKADVADARAELAGIRMQISSITVPDSAAIADLAAQARARIAKTRGEALAVARAELAGITTQLGEAKRRDDLEKRRAALEARLAEARGEVKASGNDAKGQALGVVRLLAQVTGGDANAIGQRIGLVKAALFIVLLEMLILLAAPGAAMLAPAGRPVEALKAGNDAGEPSGTAAVNVARLDAVRADKPRLASAPIMTAPELAALRKAFGESQEVFAKRFAVSTRTISRWERGERCMTRQASLEASNLASGMRRARIHAV